MGEYCMAAIQAGPQAGLKEVLPPVVKVTLGLTRRPTSAAFLWPDGRHSLVLKRHSDRATLPRKQRFNPKSFLQDERIPAVRPGASADILTGAGQTADAETVGVWAEAEEHDESADALGDVQVLSIQEQKKLAATPAHPDALNAMYGTFVLACLLERVWRFAWPVVLAVLHDSLLPVAVVGFVCQHTWYFAGPAVVALLHDSLLPVAVISFASQLVIFIGASYVGALMDSMPRLRAFNTLSAIQIAAMIVSAAVTIYALSNGVATVSTAYGLLLQPWFTVLVLAGAVERLTGLATDVAIERDWVVQLAGANRPIALANANAMLRRVDLMCEIAGPFAFGLLLSTFSPAKCLYMAAAAMAASLPVLVILAVRTDKLSSGALNRPKHINHRDSPLSQASSTSEGQGFDALLGWKKYLAHPVLPASLAYVLLYFNAVLVPGGLMTSFLTQRGLNPSVIGTFRGLCAAMGFAATFLSASLISKLGVLKAGAVALIFQAALLTMAVSVYWFNPLGSHGSLFLFLFLVVMSRLGQWAYDMVDAQIFQTAIPMSEANLIGTTEVSLASLAELIMLGLAIVANDVSHFGGLAALSTAAVIGAAWVYWSWISKPTIQQRRLFAQDPHFEKLDSALQLGLDMIIPTPQSL